MWHTVIVHRILRYAAGFSSVRIQIGTDHGEDSDSVEGPYTEADLDGYTGSGIAGSFDRIAGEVFEAEGARNSEGESGVCWWRNQDECTAFRHIDC